MASNSRPISVAISYTSTGFSGRDEAMATGGQGPAGPVSGAGGTGLRGCWVRSQGPLGPVSGAGGSRGSVGPVSGAGGSRGSVGPVLGAAPAGTQEPGWQKLRGWDSAQDLQAWQQGTRSFNASRVPLESRTVVELQALDATVTNAGPVVTLSSKV